jgi:tryptophan 2,3-dioxygenase
MSDWVILGCGYVGTRLTRALLAAGERVRVCARNTQRLAELGALGAQVHALDGAKVRAFGPALYNTGAPVVVYSIPPIANLPSGEPLRRAAEAAMTAGAQRFIYLSSTAVYGETPDGETVDEDTPVAIADADAAPRIAEESAVETARLGGLQTVILRLTAIYGPGRGVRERLKAGTYKLVDDGAHTFSRVHVDDIVGIIRAAADRAPSAALYCVADDHPSTQREYADWLTRRMGTPPPQSVPSLAPGVRRRAVRNRFISNARLKRELDYTFKYPSYVEGEQAIEREEGGASAPPPAPEDAAPAAPIPVEPTHKIEPPPSSPPIAVEPPRSNPFDARYDTGASEYERYLRTAELLALQKPPEARAHADELLFQVVHQNEELWMKAMVHELGEMVVATDGDRLSDARRALERVARLGVLLSQQLGLLETMLPSAYLLIRAKLGRGSGLDSPGFVRLGQIAPDVWRAFERALARRGVDLMKLYADPRVDPPLLAVAEGLVDFDAAVQRFKREHILIVRRIIGIGTASLRGNPMELLEKSAQLTFFPSLWAVRDGMFVDFKASD